MRKFVVAAAMALGLVMLWAVILPLTAQPAPAQTTAASSTMAKALFLCRGPNGIDRGCAAALGQALVLDAAGTGTGTARVSGQFCHVDRQMLASLERRS